MENGNRRVLIVEKDINHGKLIKLMLETSLAVEADIFESNFNSLAYLATSESEYFLSVVKLDLKDLETEKIVDLLTDRGTPLIFYTEKFNDEVRKKLTDFKATDYIVKNGNQTLAYLLKTVDRLMKNLTTKILIVDDSMMIRTQIATILEPQMYQLEFADGGEAALEKVKAIEDLHVAVIDYTMPDIDGIELTKRLRKRFKIDQLSIIGISSSANTFTAIEFLKAGANDFITKPFIPEELNLRIRQNVEMMEALDKLRVTSITDHLTGLYNRRYFFDTAERLFENCRRGDISLSISMLDIDHFKNVNDTFGHEAGDNVLKTISRLITANFRTSDLVSRFGGEEFCIITTGTSAINHITAFERMRQRIEDTEIKYKDHSIKVTISIGIATEMQSNLNETIKTADDYLYKAKQRGRNRIVSD